jgi:Sap, sulfolipid-1-addressing protein
VQHPGASVTGSGSMLVQAAGLAVLAAISPTALLVVAVYLGSARPRVTAAFYLAGAVAMSLVTGVILLAILRNAQLSHPADHTPRYGVRLGLGILLWLAAVVVARRKRPPPDPARAQQGLVSRMAASPAPLSAFAVGVLIFAPGATFLAALQVIATSDASIELTTLAVLVVVVINVILVWLPIVVHMVAPDRTERYLTSFNGWLRVHGRIILIGVLIVVGAFMVANGIYGLTDG